MDYSPVQPDHITLATAAFDGTVYDPATEMAKIDWWRFHNSAVADALLFFAKEARQIVPEPKQLGAFFGYFYVSDNKITSFEKNKGTGKNGAKIRHSDSHTKAPRAQRLMLSFKKILCGRCVFV